MTGTILIISVSLTVIGLIFFFRFAPQIGGTPQGERMEHMQLAKNYRGGRFHNTIPTGMNMKSGRILKVMWELIILVG